MNIRNIMAINLILTIGLLASCNKDNGPEPPTRDYKQEMKDFVQDLSAWAKTIDQNFYIIPQNGHELITSGGRPQDDPDLTYLDAIDGAGREDLIYGYHNDDQESPHNIQQDWAFYLQKALLYSKLILVTDYCSTQSHVDTSYERNARNGFISFAASHRNLNNIPTYPAEPYKKNNRFIQKLDSAKNFLYILDPEALGSKAEFINEIKSTNYDLLITDLFINGTALTPSDLEQLREKANGGLRLLLCYMSIGEAENYRYYWNSDWITSPPSWLKAENPDWPGNYKVTYWEKGWQDIIFGNNDSYLKKILDAGFDGVYLDIIDAFEYFEEYGEE